MSAHFLDYVARSLAADEGDLRDICLSFSPVHCMSLAVYSHMMAHPGTFSSKPCAFLCSTLSQCLENGHAEMGLERSPGCFIANPIALKAKLRLCSDCLP